MFLNLGTVELVLILTFGVVPFGLMLYCLIDIVKSNFKDGTNKLVWVLIVLFAPVIGGLLYLLFGRKQKQLNA